MHGGAARTDELLTIARTVGRELQAVLEPELGVSVDQWRALRRLSVEEGASMTALADGLGLPPATITRLVDSLVDRGLVHRAAPRDDRRRVLAYLTEEGARIATMAESLVAEHEPSLVRDLWAARAT